MTVATARRRPVLAARDASDSIRLAWDAARDWSVGRYVFMPDHLHFFCAPASWPVPDFHRWMAFWKSLAAKAFWNTPTGRGVLARLAVPAEGRRPPLFQRDCWDTQLRIGERYSEKWQYVRENPVRKGLSTSADDWPWQGEIRRLEWHD